MKSVRQQKRKIVEIVRKQDEYQGVPVKKSADGIRRVRHEATENIQIPRLQSRMHIPSRKIKLQLFPISESTRMRLEEDGYNPFLELTLSARKKISSVVRHLNTKWSGSTIARGQLMLFPYNTSLEKVAACQKWTLNDDAITAWEVYVAVDTPFLFRLRYDWDSNIQQSVCDGPPGSNELESHKESEGKISGCTTILDIRKQQEASISKDSKDEQNLINVIEVSDSTVNEMKVVDVMETHKDEVVTDVPVQPTMLWDDTFTNLSIGGLLSEVSLLGKFKDSDLSSLNESVMQPTSLLSDASVGGLLSEASLQAKMSNPDKSKLDGQTVERMDTKFESPWDDCFNTLSIGGLLSEVSLLRKAGCNPEPKESESCLRQSALLSDSFDAFVMAQICQHSQVQKPSCDKSTLSIFDAEETCHAFPIQKLQLTNTTTVASSKKVHSGG